MYGLPGCNGGGHEAAITSVALRRPASMSIRLVYLFSRAALAGAMLLSAG